MTYRPVRFDVALDLMGKGKGSRVAIEGHDITHGVTKVALRSGVDEVTELDLTVRGTVNVEGEDMTTSFRADQIVASPLLARLGPDDRVLDRKPSRDPRNLDHTLHVPKRITPGYKRWSPGPVLDQGNIGGCVGWGTSGALSACPGIGAAAKKRLARNEHGRALYMVATDVDDIEGEYPRVDTGSSVLAGMKAAQMLGYVSSYSWVHDAAGVYAALLTHGPVVLGTNWYQSMFTPKLVDKSGVHWLDVRPTSGLAGGHCYFAYAAHKDGSITIRNSWGDSWGDNGSVRVTQPDLNVLLNADGDAAVPTIGVAA